MLFRCGVRYCGNALKALPRPERPPRARDHTDSPLARGPEGLDGDGEHRDSQRQPVDLGSHHLTAAPRDWTTMASTAAVIAARTIRAFTRTAPPGALSKEPHP